MWESMNIMIALKRVYRFLRGFNKEIISLVLRYYLRIKHVSFVSVESRGLPIIHSAEKNSIVIGNDLVMNNNTRYNHAGINHPCVIATTAPNAKIVIGDHVGMSGVSIVARSMIKIGSNVNIGANASIWDNDFHSLDFLRRRRNEILADEPLARPITIEDDVWIGANAIILKGVFIGKRSIVAAGSIVTRDVPPDVIVAGNPARIIRSIKE